MIGNIEMSYIEEKVASGTLSAIAAHRVIRALTTQQREIKQLRDQLKNCQSKCRMLGR